MLNWDANTWWGILCVVVYTGSVLFGRTLFFGWPSRVLLLNRARELEGRLALDQANPGGVDLPESQIEASVRSLLRKAEEENRVDWQAFLANLVKWNGGTELAGWRLVREAEREMVLQLDDKATLARVRRALADLTALPKDTTAELTKALQRYVDADKPSTDYDQARRDLRETYVLIHQRMDAEFQSAIELQNKSMWLIVAGVFLAFVVSLAFSHTSILLLAGAVGGLLSRLRHVFSSKDMPMDYGASWVPLFLSPVVGALTGWGGTYLLAATIAMGVIKFDKLDSTQFALNATVPLDIVPIGIALVMGFAEQLFDGVAKQVEEAITKAKPA